MPEDKVRFGVLSTAKIAVEKVIPAMQQGHSCKITAIASRTLSKANKAADKLGIPVFYGSYEELLNDPEIDAVYIPLPNHMHVEWAVKCLEAGKHVLCEKPIGLSSQEADQLLSVSKKHPDLKIMEAFMYRFHPRWQRTRELVQSGEIGEIKAIQSFFAYYNDDPGNIRNIAEMGGGGLMDIGCYCISLSRFLFGREPDNIIGVIEKDPDFNTDRLASGILDFTSGTSVFTCSTQSYPGQFVVVYGTRGKIEMDWPFNTPVDTKTSLIIHKDDSKNTEIFEAYNQYTLQGDAFSEAILNNKDVPTPLEDAASNIKAIDKLKKIAG